MNEKPTILIVDDDEILLKTLVKLLRSAQYRTLQAINGIDALKMVDELKPDLVLLDVNLPDMNGLDVCRHIKTGEQKDTFVILISGLSTDSDSQAEGLDCGADGYLVRPISNKELLARVNAMLRIQTAEQALRESEEHLRSIYENLPLAYQSLDEKGYFLDINKAWLEMLGYGREEVIGKWFGDFLDNKLHELFRKRFLHFKTNEEVNTIEYEMVRKDGAHIIVSFDGHIQYDSQKNFIRTHCILTDITERKQAEITLQQSEQKFRLLLEHAGMGVGYYDLEGNVIFFNNAALQVMGGKPEDYIGKNVIELYGKEFGTQIKQRIIQVAQTEKAEIFEDLATIPTGTKWFMSNYACVYDASAEVIGVQIISQDITEKKHTEDALNESQRRLMTLMGNLPGMAYRCRFDDQWTMEFVSEGCYDLTGYRPDDLINNHKISFSQLVYPEDRLKDWEVIQSEVAKNRSFTFTYRIITATGQIKWIWEQGQGVYSADGSPAALEGFIIDISDQKRSEEALNNITIRQEAILASIPDILMEVDVNKVYTWANPAGCHFFGEDVIGHQADDYFMGDQDVYNTVQPLFDGSEDTVYIESWQRRFDGEKRLLAWWCRVLKDENDNVVGALSTARDITETRLAEEEIQALNTELEERVERRTLELSEAQDKILRQEKLAVLGQLAGGVGHELRNPLGVISNAAYFLKILQPEMDGKVKQYLEMIETETRTAEKIITDLLEFARVKSVVKEKVSVDDLIEFTLSRRPAPFNISIKNDLPADLPLVNVDPRQISQILENLVVNAFQAMPEGGELSIHGNLYVKENRNYVSISIRDTGSGISKENMGKLFEPLFTTKHTGIGLGLAVCRKLIEVNEGWIEVQSKEGKGTVFTIHLPAVVPDVI